ncbi:tetratricopeptide repeat protein [Flaviaesturariibacter flavus]|uniref:Tetratricopeptide repeat protein n=1 Tax=Flaviaesturariibacter flavus TaxID=2502780 RepID=A0A4R1B4R9_9BACT|nr:tetratricopeptide repeat protein [Flaviaesturariibacter flavus]TCJ12470.1 tetratricopeptide repeat protein [Flaviaesturariibacter flavus]
MFRRLLSFFVLALFVACNNTESDPMLSKPPYSALTDSIGQAPRNADLWYRRGQLLFQNDEFDRARADLRQAWRLAPREDIGLSLATALRRISDDSAFVFLQGARKQLPQSLPLAIGLARAYQKKGQAAAALELCDNILKVFPNQLDARSLKAELQQEAGDEAGALHTLETAHAFAPSDGELAHRLAFAYAQSGNNKTLALADSLIAADKEAIHAEPYYFKGIYFSQKGNNKEALRQLNEAIEHDYTFIDAYMEKGQLQYNAKQYAAAEQTYTLALRITPTFADAWHWLAKAQEAQGKKAEAKANYQKAFGLDKSNTEAKAAADKL